MPVAGAAAADPNIDAAVGAVTAAARDAMEQLVTDLQTQNASLTQQVVDLKAQHTTDLADLETKVQELQSAIDADQGETPPTGA